MWVDFASWPNQQAFKHAGDFQWMDGGAGTLQPMQALPAGVFARQGAAVFHQQQQPFHQQQQPFQQQHHGRSSSASSSVDSSPSYDDGDVSWVSGGKSAAAQSRGRGRAPPQQGKMRTAKRRQGAAFKLRKACEFCTNKKIRCSGELPCKQCTNRGLTCEYAERKPTLTASVRACVRACVALLVLKVSVRLW